MSGPRSSNRGLQYSDSMHTYVKNLILPTDYLKNETLTIFLIYFSFVVSKIFMKVKTVCV